ncbi:MAG: carbamate kinase [Calditrichota bacterium]
MDHKKVIVVALGGNAITQQFEEGNIHQQFAHSRQSLKGVVELIAHGYRVLVTHGNGPQVGNALIRVEESRNLVPILPLGVIVADTEGGMGYMIEQCLQNKMRDRGIFREVTTIVTQILVNPDDPSISNPSKFVGPFYVVPSPIPVELVGKNIIKLLVENDIVVIAAGGGGIPVYIDKKNGWYEGIDAVIDKDLASAILARDINADELMILTAVEKVALNFKKPDQKDLDTISLPEAIRYLEDGHFPAGSMGPKIQAAINFLESGGKKVTITSIEKSIEAIHGKAGTTILP